MAFPWSWAGVWSRFCSLAVRIQVKTATNTKRRQIQNGDTPKRRQTKTATRQNGNTSKMAKDDTSKTATTKTVHIADLACHRFGYNQNSDKSKTATRLKSDNPTYLKHRFDLYPKRCMSPFWIQPKRRQIQNSDTSKWRHTKTVRVGVYAVFNLSPFLICWIQVNMAFWMSFVYKSSWIVAVLTCRRFGCIQNGDKLKTANTPFWRVPILDVSPFLMCPHFGCPRFGVSPFWMCRRFDRYPG